MTTCPTQSDFGAGAILRLPERLFARVHEDLRRPHPFAAERVGFLFTRNCGPRGSVAFDYATVEDEHYVPDSYAGARIGAHAIQKAMQRSLSLRCGVFHVHAHYALGGVPHLSRMDLNEIPRLVQTFSAINSSAVHGILLLSENNASGLAWPTGSRDAIELQRVVVVGGQLNLLGSLYERPVPANAGDRFDRQSFLGAGAQKRFHHMRVGIAGLGGGGSHIAQQLAHLGFGDVDLFDADHVEDSNLNRLIGGTAQDVIDRTAKVDVASRLIRGLNPEARVRAHRARWQERDQQLKQCDLVFGCLDTFSDRSQLESLCRRFLIPYVDIGMNVHAGTPPRMAGQVVMSLPGYPCFWCLGLVTKENMTREAERYGAAGHRPQVVWSNGTLASTAVGQSVKLVSGWAGSQPPCLYLVYDGNRGLVYEDHRLPYTACTPCSHYPAEAIGEVVYRALSGAL